MSVLRSIYSDAAYRRLNPPIFIVKPGEDSNRGNGIELADNYIDLRNLIDAKQTHQNGKPKTYIV